MWLRGFIAFAVCFHLTSGDKNRIRQVLLEKCSSKYSLTCFKLEVLRLLGNLGNSTRVNLGSGVILVGTEETSEFAKRLEMTAREPRTKEEMDDFILDSAADYLGTLNVTFQMRKSKILDEIKQFSGNVWSGRGRKRGWYAIGTVAAVGFALLAALSGKALMASMLALLMSGILSLRNGGGGNFGSPAPSRIMQYEIISRPAAYATGPAHYYDHEHHHTAAAYTAPYAYTRRQTESSEDKREHE